MIVYAIKHIPTGNLKMTRTLVLITLLSITACGGGGDCDAGTPVLGKQSADCVDPVPVKK